MTGRPGRVPTPRDLAAAGGSWATEQLEDLQPLDEMVADRGDPADLEPGAPASSTDHEEALRPSPVRRWIARGAQALDRADKETRQVGRVSLQVRAVVCGVYAVARGISAGAAGVHRVADALERIADATERQGGAP